MSMYQLSLEVTNHLMMKMNRSIYVIDLSYELKEIIMKSIILYSSLTGNTKKA